VVLVVEDSSTQRRIITALLTEQLGAQVVHASDGLEALAVVAQRSPALVLTGMVMPELDGLELVEEIGVRHPGLPVILMTATGSEELALRALQAGAVSYFPKSLLKAELCRCIESILQAAQTEHQRNHLLESVKRVEADFELENDPTLIPLFIRQMQEQMLRMNLCTENGKIRIGVALEEALLNALYHGNLEVSSELRQDGSNRYNDLAEERRTRPPYRNRRLHVQTRLSTREAVFVIRDEGRGFDMSQLPDPTDPENMMRAGGRGLLLIRTFMDEVFHNATGNQITMVKRKAT
jgi:CheY-like chemotaxis protein/anti-sigma regulatory factor (Ser/Thr protein kinase)